MSQASDRRNARIAAASLTALLFACIVLWLVWGVLAVHVPDGREWPPHERSEVEVQQVDDVQFTEWFVASSGDNVTDIYDGDTPGPSDIDSADPTQDAFDLNNNAPQQGNATSPTTSTAESPMPQRDVAKPGNTKPAEDAAAAEARRQQQAQQNINDRLSNRFSGGGQGQGATSDVDGRNPGNGQGGPSGLQMTASKDIRPSSRHLGSLFYDVVVNPDGTIKSATLNLRKSTGDAANDAALIRQCDRAVYRCRFSRPEGALTAKGTVKFLWE